jgi:hypoxanthine-guanine phosphoribosyltransferase/GNAT superfamily N-acetyltransferase
MITYFLGAEEVDAYLGELVDRLKKCAPIPNVWCALTESGVNLLDALKDIVAKEAPEMVEKVQVVSAWVEEETKAVKFDSETAAEEIRGQYVLLFDGAVHTGSSMEKTYRALQTLGAAKVSTYSLVLKRSSRFIPSLWGVMVSDLDRAYFLLDKAPNNRLTTHLSEKHPYLHLRHLSDDDVKQPCIDCGVASMDRTTWGDRRFDMIESGQRRCTYVLETSDGIVGYLTVHSEDSVTFAIDEVAIAKCHQKAGYGGVLMRFADTFARHGDYLRVRLNAIKNMVEWYQRFGYNQVPGSSAIPLENEKYVPMERMVLHQIPRMRR